MNTHQKVYKLTSLLLQYPKKEWLQKVSEMKRFTQTLEDSIVKDYLTSFLHYITSMSYVQLCEQYVKTFDFHGVATLNLTYSVFKNSRKRGQALVQLRKIFNESNLQMETDELPDYLPMILEFLAIADQDDATRLLKLHFNSIKKLEKDLVENDSPYHFLLKAILTTAKNTLGNMHVS